MSTKRTAEARTGRTVRMAPAAPRRRGGPATAASTYASSRALEYTAGGFIWR